MLFKRKETPKKIQSLSEMIAYSLTNENTRSLWSPYGLDLVSEKLNTKIPSSIYFDRFIIVNGKHIKIDSSECRVLDKARANWRDWYNNIHKQAAMIDFVDAFERAALCDSRGE